MKKLFISLFICSVIILGGCNVADDTIVLPNLVGKSQNEAVNILTNLNIVFSFDTVINLDIPEGNFTNYGDDLKAGDHISKDTHITVYFSVHENILPDLTGKNATQILRELSKLDVYVALDYFETDAIEEGKFSHYGNFLTAGDKVADKTEITVYIGIASTMNQQVIISKYVEGTGNNKAIEIYNGKNEAVDLSRYVIDLYLNGATSYSQSINLTGLLESKTTFVIAHNLSNTDLLNKADVTSSQLTFNGDDAVVLAYSDHRIIDAVGNIGWTLMFLDNKTIVRKPGIEVSSKIFDMTTWDTYSVDNWSSIGIHPVDFPTSFTFDENDLNISFENPRGMVKVTYQSSYDGDTAYFTPGFTGADRVRFVGINTREMDSGDPLAYAARDYLDNILRAANNIYIQHDPSTGLKDTYGRNLGLVWADGLLVNWQMVKMGYSHNMYTDYNYHFIYNGVTLHQWFIEAENYAKLNHLGVWN